MDDLPPFHVTWTHSILPPCRRVTEKPLLLHRKKALGNTRVSVILWGRRIGCLHRPGADTWKSLNVLGPGGPESCSSVYLAAAAPKNKKKNRATSHNKPLGGLREGLAPLAFFSTPFASFLRTRPSCGTVRQRPGAAFTFKRMWAVSWRGRTSGWTQTDFFYPFIFLAGQVTTCACFLGTEAYRANPHNLCVTRRLGLRRIWGDRDFWRPCAEFEPVRRILPAIVLSLTSPPEPHRNDWANTRSPAGGSAPCKRPAVHANILPNGNVCLEKHLDSKLAGLGNSPSGSVRVPAPQKGRVQIPGPDER